MLDLLLVVPDRKSQWPDSKSVEINQKEDRVARNKHSEYYLLYNVTRFEQIGRIE